VSERHETRVEALCRAICVQILDGELPAGARLPSVRTLAETHDVNVSTIQRVLARLSELGLVRAHDRRGVEVLDVTRVGGSTLWRLRLERVREDPGPALEVLRDAFAIRRTLAGEVLAELACRDWAEYGADLQRTIAAFVDVANRPDATASQMLAAESEILRTLLLATGRPAVLAIVNDVNAMIAATDDLVAAIYRDPQVNASTWQSLEFLLSSGMAEPEALAGVHTLLAELDVRMIDDFSRRIGAPP
jgi:DNA-binding FadR family transcriptional regulator